MNAEVILDAMNYLDDDLIAATEKIRTRKKKSYLYVLAAAAACLCLLVVTQNEKSFAPMESASGEYSPMEDRFYGELKPAGAVDNEAEVPMENAGASGVIFTATVMVTELHEEMFVGSITTDADGSELCHEMMEIQCEPEILAALDIGDILQIRYTAGASNILVDYSVVNKDE